uniref:Ankyrin repeat and SAM domain-containing protein 3 n=1 Tax=Callorhinchus milii TaxID=7868 RepID=V9KEN1_CALMI
MSELSDESSETELFNRSLSMWHGFEQLISCEELEVPLDLHTASSLGQYEVVKECARRGTVNLNRKNRGGWTPLMYASYIGHDTIAHLLLEEGVDVNLVTDKGQSSLMLAASCGNESIAYFLLQQGAELEMKDNRGWTALFHCTSTGHQQMVKFLLDNGADANLREPLCGFTPLMEAAASGHEIIVQYLLNHGVQVDMKAWSGDTARLLALTYGYVKITTLIDLHTAPQSKSIRRDPGLYEDLSSSDESCPPRSRHLDPRPPHARKPRGPSIHDGPQALAQITGIRAEGWSQQYESLPPQGYLTFNKEVEDEDEDILNRDVTSPINEQDVESNSSREENSFFTNDAMTIRRSSSSCSEGLARVLGVSREGSLESNEDSDQANHSPPRRVLRTRRGHGSSSSSPQSGHSEVHLIPSQRVPSQNEEELVHQGPQDLAEFLEQIGCQKYLSVFEEQDVDLRVFLTLTEADLREVGITLFGPKRKMAAAIARWHSNAPALSHTMEQVYADRLETEMQEMAIQLHKKCEEVEMLSGQVTQERELRTIVESFLMEDKIAWQQHQKRVKETQGLCEHGAIILEHVQESQTEQTARSIDAGGQRRSMQSRKQARIPKECEALRVVEQNLEKLLNSDNVEWTRRADL